MDSDFERQNNHPHGSRAASCGALARLNWLALFLLAIALCFAPTGASAADVKRVLFLHSFDRESAPYDATVSAIRTQLLRAGGEPVALFDVSLGAGQTSLGPDFERSFIEFLRHRFGSTPPDVVVTIAPPAAAFYLQNRNQTFPGIPVVIAALDIRLVPQPLLRQGDAVVASRHDVSALVRNILQVLPDTRRIAVVVGDSQLERFWVTQHRAELAGFPDDVTFEWLNKMSFDQIHSRAAALPPHTAILYTTFTVDAAGIPHERQAALADLLAVSTAPVFSIYESEFGTGVVGGPFQSQQRRGEMTAAAVRRALSGENRSAAPSIQVVGYEPPVYDWRALKRWGINTDLLPANSTIRFRPPSVWDEHRALITTAVSIVVLQAVLLIALLWQRAHRRRAEREALSLSGRLITAHEDERRWLARELHDDITQRLAGLAIDASKLSGSGTAVADREPHRAIREGLVQLSEDVHSLSYRLHPSVLDDLGLTAALKSECDRVSRSANIRVNIEAIELPEALPKEVTLCIYRVAQESLRNTVRHAGAEAVDISLAMRDGGVLLAVRDNGAGFDPVQQPRKPSLGHASMRERIRSLGGRLDIQAAPGAGTTVLAWLPLAKGAQ